MRQGDFSKGRTGKRLFRKQIPQRLSVISGLDVGVQVQFARQIRALKLDIANLDILSMAISFTVFNNNF